MQPEEPHGYEPNQVDSHKVIGLVVLLLAAIVLCLTGVAWLLGGYQQHAASQQPPLSALEREGLLPPAPRLQSRPRQDAERQLAVQRIHLDSFGWVDRDQRIVHLPLQTARQIMLEQGWPTP
jgi:cytochrome c-type biogenesis protein CcmH/NrfG